MRNLILLAAVIGALVWVGRNYTPQSKSPQAHAPGETVSRGTVDDVRRQPDAVMDMGNAMSGGGTSSKAMLDTARGATN